jgi:Putative FMN-binding domain
MRKSQTSFLSYHITSTVDMLDEVKRTCVSEDTFRVIFFSTDEPRSSAHNALGAPYGLEKLTDQNEAPFSEPWDVTDAPVEFTEKLFESIVGIEMKITKLVGKWKVGQNQPLENQLSVIKGLKDNQQQEMADLIKKNEL